MRTRLVAPAVALALLAAACGGGGANGTRGGAPDDRPFRGIAPREGVTSRILGGTLTLEVTGARSFEWTGDTPINVLTSVGSDMPENIWFLTVGVLPQHILEVDGGPKVRPAFDLVGYRGGGDYAIRPPRPGGLTEEELEQLRDGGVAVDQGGFIQSGTVFIVSDNDEEVTNYNALEEPCTVTVSDMGVEGSIECPRASNGSDEISYRWSWSADPNDVIDEVTPGQRDANSEVTSPSGSSDAPGSRPEGGGGAEPATGDAPSEDGSGDRYGLRQPYKLAVDITPADCATRGTAAVVQVDTIPHANITLVIVYADAQPHGNTTLGTTGPTGDFNWAFDVPATAPDGPADLIVNVSPPEESDETESAGGIIPAFEVRARC